MPQLIGSTWNWAGLRGVPLLQADTRKALRRIYKEAFAAIVMRPFVPLSIPLDLREAVSKFGPKKGGHCFTPFSSS